MTRIRLRVVPEPGAGTRVASVSDSSIVISRGGDTADQLVCGSCGTTLLEIEPGMQLRDIVIQCPKCESFNDPTPMDA